MYISYIIDLQALHSEEEAFVTQQVFVWFSKQTFSAVARGINKQPGVQTGPAITRYLHSTL